MEDLVNTTKGNFKILEYLGVLEQPKGKRASTFIVDCLLCNNPPLRMTKHVIDYQQSCGCLLRAWQHNAKARTTHGQSKEKLYGVWAVMKQRCYNPNSQQYADYGAKGVTVCKEWYNSYEVFRA